MGKQIEKIVVPDIGTATHVNVVEVLVKEGDTVDKETSLITLEGEKATMEIPSPYAGLVKKIIVKVGDKVSAGDLILEMETPTEGSEQKTKTTEQKTESKPELKLESGAESQPAKKEDIHAGPGVRRLAREFSVDLHKIKGSGAKDRILKEDLEEYVKQQSSIPSGPQIDFNKFGKTESQPLSRIQKISGSALHRNWLSIPHVTQFGEADITELEDFRQQQHITIDGQDIKITPIVFIMKAVVAALKKFPHFNASLDASGENLILKKYFHLGVAVDTPQGLVVPVIRDVDQKGLLALAKELAEVSQKARQKGLGITDMQGGSFSISSLGGIGGTTFTPIINAPEVAILGVSRIMTKPVYQQETWQPRLMLPLSLSYDHRVIDGADGARFMVYLTKCLADIRTLLLM